MTKEEFDKLSEEQKNEMKAWFEPAKQEESDKVETQPDETLEQKKEPKEETDEKSDNKVDKESDPEPDDKEQKEVEDKEDTEKTDEKVDYEKIVQDSISKTVEPLLAKIEKLEGELADVKSKSPVANFKSQPSDKYQSKVDEKRDDFVTRFRNQEKSKIL